MYSEMTDVFYFVWLLFTLLMGKSSLEFLYSTNALEYEPGEDSETDWIESYLRQHGINGIVDPTILVEGGVPHHHQFQAVFQLILGCCRMHPEDVAKQLDEFKGMFLSLLSYLFIYF